MTNALFRHLPTKALAAAAITVAVGLPLGAFSAPATAGPPTAAADTEVSFTNWPNRLPTSDELQKVAVSTSDEVLWVQGKEPTKGLPTNVKAPRYAKSLITRSTITGDQILTTAFVPRGCVSPGWTFNLREGNTDTYRYTNQFGFLDPENQGKEFAEFAQKNLKRVLSSTWICPVTR